MTGFPASKSQLAEWEALGPPLRSKPSSEEEAAAWKDRKDRRTALKKRLQKDLANGDEGPEWSFRAIEREMDRLVWPLPSRSRSNNNQNKHDEGLPAYQLDPDHPDNTLDHRDHPDQGPLLKYLWTSAAEDDSSSAQKQQQPALQGQTLYLGGEVGSDGNLYCIPGHAPRVLKIDPGTQKVCTIGPDLLSNRGSPHTSRGRLYKWLRGIVVGDLIYGLPCHADDILRIDVANQTVTTIPIPYEAHAAAQMGESAAPSEVAAAAKAERETIWKYHGGAICPLDGCIYAIPQTARHVLKIDPTTEEVSLVGPAFEGRCKWYGGIVGKQDGAIYGIPQNAGGVLRIAPEGVTVHGDYGAGNHKWHGGAAAANGTIVSVPANSHTVLCVVPGNPPRLSEHGRDAVVAGLGRHRADGKYKYLGASPGPAPGASNRVYLFPCASERVLQVDATGVPEGGAPVVKNVGPNLRDSGLETVHQNKWQNGLTCAPDRCVYGMPLSGHSLLRIDCSAATGTPDDDEDPVVTTWRLPPPRIDCRDKFEGGIIMDSGVMFTVPNNHKGILRIEPACLGSRS